MEKIGKTPENSGNLKIEKLRNVRKPRETSRKVGKIRKTKENSEKSKKFNNSEIVEKLGKHPIKSEKLGKTRKNSVTFGLSRISEPKKVRFFFA